MNAWTPVSPCTTACLPAASPSVPLPAAAVRLAAVADHLAGTLPARARLAAPDERRRRARSLLDAMGVRVDVREDGREAPGGGLSVSGGVGTLVVANHVSWLDVLVLLSVEPVTMLAKQEIARWPLLGALARGCGTRFIDRGSLHALPRTVAALADLLRGGTSVMVFPEGTTRCGGAGGPFRRAVFQAALDARAPVRPVALAYLQRGAPTTVAAYVGDGTFTASFHRVLTADALTARLDLRPAIRPLPGVDDRRALAARSRAVLAGHRTAAP
ncbi:lysophospholipid acyltransferase family protein [Actinocorallia libanotica]|uniref:Lysophospholipid acyltransferase family protein n=1 Tax=Actinocorallia libanotica TaxID=46162 RepID=A0ABN1RR77_9ACTN